MTADKEDEFDKKVTARIQSIVCAKNKAAQQPIDQHYLPKTYQKRFASSEGKFHLYNLRTRKYHESFPGRAGKQPHIYTRWDENGGADFSIEHFFSVIEDDSAAAIDKIIAGHVLTDDDRFWISFFWGAAFCRSPDLMQSYQYFFETLTTRDIQQKYSTVENTERWLQSQPSTDPSIDVKELYEHIQSKDYKYEVKLGELLEPILRLMPSICHIIGTAQRQIHRAPPGESFITTDNPVALIGYTSDMKPGQRALGFNTQGAVKILPLSPEVCLFAGPPGRSVEERQMNRDLIRTVNIRLATDARELIISRDKALLTSLVKYTGADIRNWSPCFKFSN